jgi:sugar-specific transcriptional regulator TrmB
MGEKNRFILFTVGVTIIIFLSLFVYSFLFEGHTIGQHFTSGIFVFYIAIAAILIFAQFLIGTTYGRSSKGGTSDLRNEYKTKIKKLNNKIRKLSSEKKEIEKELRHKNRQHSNLKDLLSKFVKDEQSLLEKKVFYDNPHLYKYEQYFLQSCDSLELLRQSNKDDFKIEAALAYTGSIKIYELLHDLNKNSKSFSTKDVADLLTRYKNELNERLNHVKAVEYGLTGNYKPDSHEGIGLIQEYERIKFKSFKIVNSNGAIIYKALAEKK